MARPFAKKFYNSKKWQMCRKAYIAERVQIDGGMCEVCHDKPGVIVHHKIWLNEYNINDPDITLNFDNLRYECQECHNMEELNGDAIKQPRLARIKFDSEGNPYSVGYGETFKLETYREKRKRQYQQDKRHKRIPPRKDF